MVTKGIITAIDLTGNTCTVRMPFFETAGNDPILGTAVISNTPGSYNGYKIGDAVLVAFEDGQMSKPVVIGKLYLGVEAEESDPRGVINVENSTVTKSAAIPADTTLGADVDADVANTVTPYKSLKSIAGKLSTVDGNLGQLDRFTHNEFNSVIQNAEGMQTAIKHNAEHIEAKVSKKDDNGNEKGLSWDLNTTSWKINAHDTVRESDDGSTGELHDFNIVTITRGGMSIAGDLKLAGYPKETEVKYLIQDKNAPAPTTATAGWSTTAPEPVDGKYIWQWTHSKTYSYDDVSEEWTVDVRDPIVCLTGAVGDSAISYWTKLSAKVHTGTNQASDIEATPYVKQGTGYDAVDLSAYFKYSLDNGQNWIPASGWSLITTQVNNKITIAKANVGPNDIIIKFAHKYTVDGTDHYEEYESETVTYSPMNTPIIDLDNDTDVLKYKPNGDAITGTVTSTAQVYLGGSPEAATYAWSVSPAGKATIETSGGGQTVTVSRILPDTDKVIVTCAATTTSFKDEGGNYVTVTKDFVISREVAVASYWLSFSPVHTGELQQTDIEIKALAKIGNDPEGPDGDAYLRYSWDNGATWLPTGADGWTSLPANATLTIAANAIQNHSLLVEATHNASGTRQAYESETITYSPLNTPVLDLTNDSATIAYNGADKLGDNVSSTATVWLAGEEVTGAVGNPIAYKWMLSGCVATGQETETITSEDQIAILDPSLIGSHTVVNSQTITVTGLTAAGTKAICYAYNIPDYPKTLIKKEFTIAKQLQGATGTSITGVNEYYYATATETLPIDPAPVWEDTIAATGFGENKKYLWNKEIINYSGSVSPSETNPAIIAVWSKDGKEIASITNYYKAHTNNSTAPEVGWTTNPTDEAATLTPTNKYLWNKETITYSDGTHTDIDPHVIGVYGDQGAPGKSAVEVITLYYKQQITEPPQADPSAPAQSQLPITTSSEAADTWSVTPQPYTEGFQWWTCEQTKFDTNPASYSCTRPVLAKDLNSLQEVAQGKSTNYYSDKNPALPAPTGLGKTMKDGDCWFDLSFHELIKNQDTPDVETDSTFSTKEKYIGYYVKHNDNYLKVVTSGGDSSAGTINYTSVTTDGNGTPTDIAYTKGCLKQWSVEDDGWKDIGGELVANKVTATYINALDITAKKITVYDTSSPARVLFKADGLESNALDRVKIAGFKVTDNSIFSDGNNPAAVGSANSVYMSTGISSTANIAGSGATSHTWAFTANNSFGVTTDGNLYSTSGKIGGFNIESDNLNVSEAGSTTILGAAKKVNCDPFGIGSSTTKWAFLAGTDTFGDTGGNGKGNFGITPDGAAYAKALNILGGTVDINGVLTASEKSLSISKGNDNDAKISIAADTLSSTYANLEKTEGNLLSANTIKALNSLALVQDSQDALCLQVTGSDTQTRQFSISSAQYDNHNGEIDYTISIKNGDNSSTVPKGTDVTASFILSYTYWEADPTTGTFSQKTGWAEVTHEVTIPTGVTSKDYVKQNANSGLPANASNIRISNYYITPASKTYENSSSITCMGTDAYNFTRSGDDTSGHAFTANVTLRLNEPLQGTDTAKIYFRPVALCSVTGTVLGIEATWSQDVVGTPKNNSDSYFTITSANGRIISTSVGDTSAKYTFTGSNAFGSVTSTTVRSIRSVSYATEPNSSTWYDTDEPFTLPGVTANTLKPSLLTEASVRGIHGPGDIRIYGNLLPISTNDAFGTSGDTISAMLGTAEKRWAYCFVDRLDANSIKDVNTKKITTETITTDELTTKNIKITSKADIEFANIKYLNSALVSAYYKPIYSMTVTTGGEDSWTLIEAPGGYKIVNYMIQRYNESDVGERKGSLRTGSSQILDCEINGSTTSFDLSWNNHPPSSHVIPYIVISDNKTKLWLGADNNDVAYKTFRILLVLEKK